METTIESNEKANNESQLVCTSSIQVIPILKSAQNCTDMQITACKLLGNSQYILSDWTNKRLIILQLNGKFSKEIGLSSRPFDITCINDNTLAVALKNLISIIQIYSETTRNISVAHGCHGLTYGNSSLFVCSQSRKEIQMIRYPSRKKKTITTPYEAINIEYVDSKLCCTNFKENIIFLLGLRGEKHWECRIAGSCQPFCVKYDFKENIYVACRQENNVLVISLDGKIKKHAS